MSILVPSSPRDYTWDMNIYLFQRILGIGILALQGLIVILITYLIYKRVSKKSIPWIDSLFSSNAMWLAGGTALLAIAGSLIFSDVYQIEPCKLCWIQRIFIYPQALIMFIAAWKNDAQAWIYALWLSILGLLVGLYQVNEQLGISDIIPEADCVAGADAACAQIHMLEFGYITFPLASVTLFVFIIMLYVMRKKSA